MNSISLIERLFNTEDKKRLISNFISLSFLQVVNYILPLITFPYLVRVLGVEKFGLIAFATATIMYFQILTDYGFNLSATREISIHRENKEKVQEIFSSVMIIKFGLLILSFILLSVLVFSFEKFRRDWEVYFLSFGMVVGQVLFPIWFFQGMEKMKYITFLNILAKGLFTIAIFIFVKQQSDYWKVPLLNSIGFILAGVLSLWIVYKDWNLGFKFVGFESILRELKEGWYVFITSIQSNILSSSWIFILGLFTPTYIVGYYSAIEKLLKGFVSLFQPITQALFPYSSNKLKKSIKEGKLFIIRTGLLTSFLSLAMVCCLVFFSNNILYIVFGYEFTKYSVIIKLLSIWLFFGVLNNFIGIQFLIGAGYSEVYLKSFNIASLVTIITYFGLTWKYYYYGIIAGMVLGEITLTIAMIYFIKKRGLT